MSLNSDLRSLLAKKGISISKSNVPSSRNAVDLTGEQAHNRHAAGSDTGILGFSTNLSAYFRWQATHNFRMDYAEVSCIMYGWVYICVYSRSNETSLK